MFCNVFLWYELCSNKLAVGWWLRLYVSYFRQVPIRDNPFIRGFVRIGNHKPQTPATKHPLNKFQKYWFVEETWYENHAFYKETGYNIYNFASLKWGFGPNQTVSVHLKVWCFRIFAEIPGLRFAGFAGNSNDKFSISFVDDGPI